MHLRRMLPRTPFIQFLAPRIAGTQSRLAEKIWRIDSTPLPVRRSAATHEHLPAAQLDSLAFEPIQSVPITWGRKFQQCWWRVNLPKAGGEARYLHWKDQAEATLYVRPRAGAVWTPSYGIDPAHRYAPLPNSAGEVVIESICCRTGIWVTGEASGVSDAGSIFEGAFLAYRDEDAWQAWHDLDVLIGVCRLLYAQALPRPYDPGDPGGGANPLFSGGAYRAPVEVAPPLLRKLLHRLTDAIDALEQNGVTAMRKQARAIFREFPAEPWAMRAVLTGHAHVDLVWKWPERIGEFKAVHSFATVNSLMETYPELHFGYSQPASYEAVERRSPELMRQVRRRIDKGNWEPTGAMYVESDTQIPCGEALVRAVDLGQAGFRDLTGEDAPVLWLPDVFGYSGAIPTILAGFDVPYFFTTKLHWSGATRFPHSAFRWHGADGSEVIGFIAFDSYNLAATPREMKWAADNQRQAGVFNETLCATGWGDGGGGPSESMCERARRMTNLAILPRCGWGRIDDFFDRLAKVREKLPTWRGEMYLEFHRGVQTTHGYLKAAYRAAERGLQVHEAARCALGGGPIGEHAWKRVCFAQFHDYLPGSSIQEVYDEGVPELEAIALRARDGAVEELAARSFSAAASPEAASLRDAGRAGRTGASARAASRSDAASGAHAEPVECIFNPLPIERIELVDGRPVRLPPLRGVALSVLGAVESAPVQRSRSTLDNGRVRVQLRKDGRIGAMSVDGRQIALAEPMCGLMSFPDLPAVWDAWDVERPTLSLGTLAQSPARARFERYESRQIARYTRRIAHKSTATVSYILEAASPVLKIEIELDWQDPQTLLKVVFPTRYAGQNARYGAPFGSTLRPQIGNTVGDEARFENPASRWACVAEETESDGLMLMTEAKYGAGCRDGLLHLSLVRSAWVTDADDNVPLRDFEAYGGSGHMQYSDIGRHVIRFAIGHFRADAPRREQPAALAETLYTPPIRYSGLPVSAGLLGIEGGESLIPAWAKPEAGGAWTLRLHETLGRRGTATLRIAADWKAQLVNLHGEAIGAVRDGGIDFTPHALISVRLERA